MLNCARLFKNPVLTALLMTACDGMVGGELSVPLFIAQMLPGTDLGNSGELLFYPSEGKGKGFYL